MEKELKEHLIKMAELEKESGWLKETIAGAKAVARRVSKPSGKRIKHEDANRYRNVRTNKVYRTSAEAATANTREGVREIFNKRVSTMKGAKPRSNKPFSNSEAPKVEPGMMKAKAPKAEPGIKGTKSSNKTHAERRGPDYKRMHGLRRKEAKTLKGKLKDSQRATKVVAGAGTLAFGGAYLSGKREGEKNNDFK